MDVTTTSATTPSWLTPEIEAWLLSAGDEFLPEVARKVRDAEELTAGERAIYVGWLEGQRDQVDELIASGAS